LIFSITTVFLKAAQNYCAAFLMLLVKIVAVKK